MIKLVVNGACGQMGRTIIRLAQSHADEFEVIAGIDAYGDNVSEGVPVYKTHTEAPKADVIIDFSRPEAVKGVLEYCEKNGARLVLGTTGLGGEQKELIKHSIEKVPVFHSGNMSLGVNLQIKLIQDAAIALGEQYEVEIIEKHHNRKVDAPSGTALMLADAINAISHSERKYVFGRHSKDERRTKSEIGLHSIRGGTVVGEHAVGFYGQDEVVTIEHQAYSKQVFAAGALRAAQYLMQKQPGLYNMQNIVTEREQLAHLNTDTGQALITISSLPNLPGVMGTIFSTIAEKQIFVDMISTISHDGVLAQVSFSLPREKLAAAMNALKQLYGVYEGMDIYALDNITKITVEGPGMALRHGVAAELFTVLANAGVCIELVTTSETKISCCVKNSDAKKAVDAINKEFQL